MQLSPNTFLSYDLSPAVTAFSTRRQGGYSKGDYASFNVNHYCGDDPDDVVKNRQLLCQSLGIDMTRLVIPHQVHGTQVLAIKEDFFHLTTAERLSALEGVDAVITRETHVCIGVSTADCIPIILYDPIHHACGVAHAGWRGTVARIVQHTLSTMRDVFDTDSHTIRAVIGPGISLDAFEVGQEVYDAFQTADFPMPRIAKRYEKWHIDLPFCNRLQLIEAGVPDANIFDTTICTYSNPDKFFSARRLGIHSGRIFTGIVLR